MAIFMPEWGRVTARELPLRRALASLDDGFTVRRPIALPHWAPDVFLCDEASRRWLAVVLCDAPFTQASSDQLFASSSADEVTLLFDRFETIAGLDALADRKLEKLVVMQRCTVGEAAQLARAHAARCEALHRRTAPMLRIAAGDELPAFVQGFAAATTVMPLGQQEHDALKARFFPESLIPASIIVRRDFHRHNAAGLPPAFLDIDQEWAAKLDLDVVLASPGDGELDRIATAANVRLVNGVAGSGKTLIAMQRALLLARLYPRDKALLLIHNTPIVAVLNHKLRRGGTQLPPNLEVTTFYKWAVQRWKAIHGRYPSIVSAQAALDVVGAVQQRQGASRLTPAQLLAEIDFINGQPLRERQHYLDAPRTGQGFALRAGERDVVWAVHEGVDAALAADGLRLWSAIPRDVCTSAHEVPPADKLRHVLIDEAQFFSPAWFRVVERALDPTAGALFLCADPSQGFLRSRLSWRSAGLDVAGKTKKLRRSYRTTRAILQAASDVLVRHAGCDPHEDLQPLFDGMPSGTAPIAIVAGTPQDVLLRLRAEVEAAARTLSLSSMLVLHGDRINDRLLDAALSRAVGADGVWWLNRKETKLRPPPPEERDRLAVAHVDTATGLEAAIVFVVGIDDLLASLERSPSGAPRNRRAGDVTPSEVRSIDVASSDLTSSDETSSDRTSNSDTPSDTLDDHAARKLYMAMTRAAQRLVLITADELPAGVAQAFVVME